METSRQALHGLGWDEWFEQRASCLPLDAVARVAAVDRGQWLLFDGTGPFRAKLPGVSRHRDRDAADWPCVGDWVVVDKQPGNEFAAIRSVIERRTSLRRKAPGDGRGAQMIAANVDHVVIVQSCHFDFNLKRLERYLFMVAEGGAEPLILLTKTDLVDRAALDALIGGIRAAAITAEVLTLSNLTREGVGELQRLLLPAKTYCFVGSSGVGKSTLINHLLGGDMQQTKTVSKTGEGRHTTVRRELIRLESGVMVIDNPGMREFGVVDADDGLASSHADIAALAEQCRYRDCRHTSEPGCAVVHALRAGEIDREHYESFLKLREESEFNALTSLEKRKKDRNFGRFVKSAKKPLRRP